MLAKRKDRISVLIKQELGIAITQEMSDPRVGFLTVTHVDLSDDAKYAKVYYRVMGGEGAQSETQKGLEKARGFLQHKLAETLKLRFTPHLTFIFDESLDEGMKVDEIIKKLHEGSGEQP